jgi:DNA ligase (NAD+)
MDNLPEIKEYSEKQMKKYCENEDISELHILKLYFDDFYYNSSDSELSDNLYDIIKDELMKRDIDYKPPIGSRIRDKENRVKIPFYMGSADKFTPKDQKELDRWIKKNPCSSLMISEKLDGVSGTFIVKNGIKKLYTRGDGKIGADISYLIQYIDNIPDVKDNISVRGELIIKKSVFDEKYYFRGKPGDFEKTKEEGRGYGRLYRNSRNMVSGLVNSKTIRNGVVDIQFVVYEIVGDTTMPKPFNQMVKLKNLGFTVVLYENIKHPRIMDEWIELHNRLKKDSEYEIDGIIVQSNVEYDRNTSANPSYMFAFKVTSEDSIFETTVLDIEWSVSQWGQIIPVALIDPVELPGNTLKRVTVSNACLMKQKMIGPGAIINVTRSKEVIPFIVSVKEPCETMKWPDMKYEWDSNNVHINIVDPSSEIKALMRVKLFSKFFAKMGIKYVSKATVSKLHDAGFDTLLKIIGASKKDLLTIAGFKEKSANRIYENIKNGLQGVKKSELLGSCGVFGYGVGKKRIISLMTDIPDLLTTNKKGLKKRILGVEGFSEIMAVKVISNIDYAIKFVDEVSKYVSFVDNTRISDIFVGKKFCFSGFRSKDLEKNIEDRGGKIVTSVSKKTSGMIVSENNSKSSGKVTKAIELGVNVYTKDEFIEKFIL